MKKTIFSTWISWDDFLETRLTDLRFRKTGVYLLAHFSTPPKGNAKSDIEEVIYIGETTQQTLLKRLDQFNNSAFKAKNGHSGGWTYRYQNEEGTLPKGKLYISILPIDKTDDDHSTHFIKYVERKAIWEKIQKTGTPPSCNRR